MQACQTLWVVAPSEMVAIDLARKHSKDRVCKSYNEALTLQMKLLGKGYKWPIWEMTFNISIVCVDSYKNEWR